MKPGISIEYIKLFKEKKASIYIYIDRCRWIDRLDIHIHKDIPIDGETERECQIEWVESNK